MPKAIDVLRSRMCSQHKRRKAKWVVFTKVCLAFYCCDECKKEWEKDSKGDVAIESIEGLILMAKDRRKKYIEKI